MKYIYFFLILLSLNVVQSYAVDRSLYVDNFSKILGNVDKEDELLKFAKHFGFNRLILYDLHIINKKIDLTNSESNQVMANFNTKAKKFYNITEVSASGESGSFFINVIHKYNLSRKEQLEKFDVYNLEFEYWGNNVQIGSYYCENYLRKNGINCNRKGGFNYFKESLEIMKLLSKETSDTIKVEAYISNCTQQELNKIVKFVDRLLITTYIQNPNEINGFLSKRYPKLNTVSNQIELSILFSAESIFMGGHFKYNSLKSIEDQTLKFFTSNVKTNYKNHVSFTYYNYSEIKDDLKIQHFRETGKQY